MIKIIDNIKRFLNMPKFKRGEKVRISSGRLFGCKIVTVIKVIKKQKKHLYILDNGSYPIEENKISKDKL